jgi:hypothetical protein
MESAEAVASRRFGHRSHDVSDRLAVTGAPGAISPEITTTYEAGYVPVLPGGHTEITGQFPHARFFSFQSSGANGRNISG